MTVSGGEALIRGGKVSNLALTGTGSAWIASSATVRNLELSGSQCSLTVANGATLSGKIDLTDGMVVADSGVNVTFDLVNDFALSLATPLITGFEYLSNANLTLSAAAGLDSGIYKLASFSNGAQFADISLSFTLDGATLGSLSVGQTITYDTTWYSLYQNDSMELIFEVMPQLMSENESCAAEDPDCMFADPCSANALISDDTFTPETPAGISSELCFDEEIPNDLFAWSCGSESVESIFSQDKFTTDPLLAAGS